MTPAEISLATRLFPQEKQLLARATPAYLCFGTRLMALSPGWRVFASFSMNHYVVLWKAVRSSGFLLFPWGHCPWRGTGSLLDPKMKAFLEENTEVTSSGTLTPEIQLRLLTPRCKFWWERADLWPLRDPYWAIYWPGGQALSRYVWPYVKQEPPHHLSLFCPFQLHILPAPQKNPKSFY